MDTMYPHTRSSISRPENKSVPFLEPPRAVHTLTPVSFHRGKALVVVGGAMWTPSSGSLGCNWFEANRFNRQILLIGLCPGDHRHLQTNVYGGREEEHPGGGSMAWAENAEDRSAQDAESCGDSFNYLIMGDVASVQRSAFRD